MVAHHRAYRAPVSQLGLADLEADLARCGGLVSHPGSPSALQLGGPPGRRTTPAARSVMGSTLTCPGDRPGGESAGEVQPVMTRRRETARWSPSTTRWIHGWGRCFSLSGAHVLQLKALGELGGRAGWCRTARCGPRESARWKSTLGGRREGASPSLTHVASLPISGVMWPLSGCPGCAPSTLSRCRCDPPAWWTGSDLSCAGPKTEYTSSKSLTTVLDLVLSWSGGHEDVGVVLGEAAQPGTGRGGRRRQLVPVHQAQLAPHAGGEIPG